MGLFDEDGKTCRLVQQKGKLVATLGSKGVLSFLEILYLMDASKLALFKVKPDTLPTTTTTTTMMTCDKICGQGIPISFQQLLDQYTSYRDLHLFHVFKYLRNMGYHCLEGGAEEFDFKVYAPSASFRKSNPATKPIKLIKVITEQELKSTSHLKNRILSKIRIGGDQEEDDKEDDDKLSPFITLALTQGNQISFIDLEPHSFEFD